MNEILAELDLLGKYRAETVDKDLIMQLQ